VVNVLAKSRCQAQISFALQLFGEPNVLISRVTQGAASEIAVPAVVVTAKATASGPSSAAIRLMAAAVTSSASSQLMRRHPGSGSPFGRLRRSGNNSRSDASTSSGEARPLAQIASPVGCDGSGSISPFHYRRSHRNERSGQLWDIPRTPWDIGHYPPHFEQHAAEGPSVDQL